MKESLRQRLAALGLPSQMPPNAEAWGVWLDRFGAGIAHELNTPLAYIRLNAEVVKSFAAEQGSAELAAAVEDMIRGLARLDAIVTELHEVPAPKVIARGPGVGARRRVLLVDDDPAIGAAVQRLLRREHDVLVACSVAEAIAIVRSREDIDVVLCDLMMPEATGMDFYEQLGVVRPALREALVFLTGGAFTEPAEKFLHETHRPCLAKPFNPAALRAVVARGGTADSGSP